MPFPYYNTASPTPTTKNSITDTAVKFGIRDFLLNKKLKPVYPQLSTNINGSPRVGEPVLDTSVNSDTNVKPNYFPVFDAGNGFRLLNTKTNMYLDSSKQTDVSDSLSYKPNPEITQQLNNYYDTYKSLDNAKFGSVAAADIIGSVLNGQGVGFTKGAIQTNFDLRASLTGRVLGATGMVNDTKLGMIGAEALAISIGNNIAFNEEQSILGSLNVADNILSLVKDGNLSGFRPNYKITVPSTIVGRLFNYTQRILGTDIPRSFLDDAGSIFQSESNTDNISRANAMIKSTGSGQIKSLISNVYANINGTTQYDKPDDSVFRSGYVPGYKDNRGSKAINPFLYAFFDSSMSNIISLNPADNVIHELNYNHSDMIKFYGFIAPEDEYIGPLLDNSGYDNRKVSNVGFSWTSNNGSALNSNINYNQYATPSEIPSAFAVGGVNISSKKTLLYKTQKLFNSAGMKNIVTAKGDMGYKSSQIETANGGGFSKGSAVLQAGVYSNTAPFVVNTSYNLPENTYCRSWTTLDRYDKVYKLVRARGLKTRYPYRMNETNFDEDSVLGEGGFVKITPYKNNVEDPKKFMFSLENLAWANNTTDLPECEIGPGDLLTGTNGRIMWFPPYDLTFSEQSNPNWEKHDFIGRGEAIYTYGNTERSGNLSFKMIIDHSSYMNAFAGTDGPDNNYVASFVAGCLSEDDYYINKLTIDTISQVNGYEYVNPQTVPVPDQPKPADFKVYWPNDGCNLDDVISKGYENGLDNIYAGGSGGPDGVDSTVTVGTNPITSPTNNTKNGYGIGYYRGGNTEATDDKGNTIKFSTWLDAKNYGLNKEFLTAGFAQKLKDHLDNICPSCVISLKSSASVHGYTKNNKKLSKCRSESIKKWLLENVFDGKDETYIKDRLKIENTELTSATGCRTRKNGGLPDDRQCKEDRHTLVTFTTNGELITKKDVVATPTQNNNASISTTVTKKFYTECDYFEKLTELDPFVFDEFRQKIRFFHPAFHSTTPEGFNSRLTFLQQCTRQGATSSELGANNLAFGTSPVCILRIGDFYNTKIVIDSLNIDYEPLVWDLNPEGVGVQPMIANVQIGFKFIGGSTLKGPINKLQNALSFNYYANSQVFDPRADYITKNNNGEYNITTHSGYTNVISTTTTQPAEENQILNDNATNSGNVQPKQDPTASITGITGISYLNYNCTNTSGSFSCKITLSLSQKGLFNNGSLMISQTEFDNFMNKGVNLEIKQVDGISKVPTYTQIITNDAKTKTPTKLSQESYYLFTSGFVLGTNDTQTIDGLSSGNYQLNAYYDGKKVGTKNLTISL